MFKKKTLQKRAKMIKIDTSICLNCDFLKKKQPNVNRPMLVPSSWSL